MSTVRLYEGDCLDVLRTFPDNSIAAVVTDPPYGLSNTSPDKVAETLAAWVTGDRGHVPAGRGFMGATWDGFVPPPAVWDEVYRVLKPGGHALVFAGSRTQDLMGMSIRLAGFDLRDSVAWLYGSGFPKSLDVSKAIDKTRDDYPAIRSVVEFIREAFAASDVTRTELDEALGGSAVMAHFLAPSRSNAGCPTLAQWETLKGLLKFGDDMDAEVRRLNGRKGAPGENWEKREVIGKKKSGIAVPGEGPRHTVGGGSLVTVDVTTSATDEARKWEGWGTALKPGHEPIILARKPLSEKTVAANTLTWGTGGLNIDATRIGTTGESLARNNKPGDNGWKNSSGGANTAAIREAQGLPPRGRWPTNVILDEAAAAELDQQSGKSTSRKGAPRGSASSGDGWGMTKTGAEYDDEGGASRFFYVAKAPSSERPEVDGVKHPTVKPLALIEHLVALITPPGGTVLDLFGGSGTTAEAAIRVGRDCIIIEAHTPYIPLIRQRVDRATTTKAGTE